MYKILKIFSLLFLIMTGVGLFLNFADITISISNELTIETYKFIDSNGIFVLVLIFLSAMFVILDLSIFSLISNFVSFLFTFYELGKILIRINGGESFILFSYDLGLYLVVFGLLFSSIFALSYSLALKHKKLEPTESIDKIDYNTTNESDISIIDSSNNEDININLNNK